MSLCPLGLTASLVSLTYARELIYRALDFQFLGHCFSHGGSCPEVVIVVLEEHGWLLCRFFGNISVSFFGKRDI